ncbi:hypothetical protein TrST_g12296 [Triparma strigata]|uniref:Uncharacterized protein n=1 Tax=Triparma strigata TaxID=1606541 RepID=A0A9W7EMP6_9STRA|nr:hypothetical protein TrST_g12296 [Triparma strigata]
MSSSQSSGSQGTAQSVPQSVASNIQRKLSGSGDILRKPFKALNVTLPSPTQKILEETDRLASKLEEALSQRAAAHWNFFTAGLFIGAVVVAGGFAGVGFGERFRSKYNAVSRSARCYSFRIEEKLEGDEMTKSIKDHIETILSSHTENYISTYRLVLPLEFKDKGGDIERVIRGTKLDDKVGSVEWGDIEGGGCIFHVWT